MNKELEVRPQGVVEQYSPEQVRDQVNAIQKLMKSVMVQDTHFGVIPGTDKPALLKPGAEKLCFTFRMAPKFKIKTVELANGHRQYDITCSLYSVATGNFLGQGVGSGSTMESKYRWRKASRKCPACGKDAIIKGKDEYGGGWLCFKKVGGCGAKWPDGAEVIESQPAGKVENPDPADQHNTVLKMAKKRALVDAVLTATAASDIFAQDIEDFPENLKDHPEPKEEKEAKQPPASPNAMTLEEATRIFAAAKTLDALKYAADKIKPQIPGAQIEAFREVYATRQKELKVGTVGEKLRTIPKGKKTAPPERQAGEDDEPQPDPEVDMNEQGEPL